MSDLVKHAMRLGRRIYLKLSPGAPLEAPPYDGASVAGQAASDLIKARLMADAPAMIARVGAVELACVANYLAIHDPRPVLRKSVSYIRGGGRAFWWDDDTIRSMTNNTGFFPSDKSLLESFCVQMLEATRCVDVLGSWLRDEELLGPYLGSAVKVRLRDLEPYYHRDPWTEALTGKTVLVVHPFVESIERQYSRRAQLFVDPRVLPEFELKTLKAVQSIGNNETGFRTWSDAYMHMRDAIADIDFDVAVLGCGAYGFPLAADVKRLGKKAVHLGGACQIWFGIKGKRWDNHEAISKLYNEYWVRPLPSERPENYSSIEDGCYW